MQTFEVLMYLLSILLLGAMILKKPVKPLYAVSIVFGMILVVVMHVIFEQIRWQLYPLYLAVLIAGIMVCFKTIKTIKVKKSMRISTIIVLVVLIVVSGVSSLIFPVYELPTPTGDYLIGTQSFVIQDDSRYEQYGDDPTQYRRIKIQLWYPAETVEDYERAPWLEDGKVIARALSKDIGLPFFALDHTADIMSHSYVSAPIRSTADPYPLIILSHGWRGFRNLHTDFAEELASHGYIVVGIDHTYGSIATVFDDNDVAYLNPGSLPDRDSTPDFLDYANQLVNTYAGDITTTLNHLEEINDPTGSSRFSDTLDLTKIGLLGHSTGGGADVSVALEDDRIDAVFGLDAWVEPIEETTIAQGLTEPSLFVRSGAWEESYNNTNLYSLIENSTSSVLYQIDGTTHYDFTMVYMYSPITNIIGFTGDVDGRNLNTILKTMITDFFDGTIKNNTNGNIDANEWDVVRIIPVE